MHPRGRSVVAHLGSKTKIFGQSVHHAGDGLQSAAAPHGTVKAPGEKGRALSVFTKCPTSLVAGARYAQRCPVEFGLPMQAVIAA